MPKQLQIFISYASEDQKLVETIVRALDGAFRRSISIKYMSLFEPGIEFRQEIDRALDAADILLVVASGKEKLSHTFTGYEVGYFRKSQDTRPLISDQPKLERLIIPVAVLTDLPDTVSEIQGVKISKPDQIFVHATRSGPPTVGSEDAMYRLLVRLDQIIISPDDSKRDAEASPLFQQVLRETSQTFASKLEDVLRSIPIHTDLPKTKLTISLPRTFENNRDDLWKIMNITVTGPTRQIFGDQMPQTAMSWANFDKLIKTKRLGT